MFAIIGLAGSGKGTLCKLFTQRNPNAKHIEMGEIIRKRMRDNTVSPYITKLMNEGSLVPNELVFEIVEENVQNNNINLLDGVPRSESQMIELLKRYPNIHFIKLSIPREVAMKRLLSRNDDRNDDYEEAINRRFEIYEKDIEKILSLTTDVEEIKTDRNLEEVYRDFEKVISNKLHEKTITELK